MVDESGEYSDQERQEGLYSTRYRCLEQAWEVLLVRVQLGLCSAGHLHTSGDRHM